MQAAPLKYEDRNMRAEYRLHGRLRIATAAGILIMFMMVGNPCEHSSNVSTMLGQRRRRWANIVPTLGICFDLL